MENTTSAPEAKSLTFDLIMAKGGFRNAASEYQNAFDALKRLVEMKVPENMLGGALKRVSDADKACGEALKELIKVHKHGHALASYLDDGNAFINRCANFAAANINPLKGENRRLTKGLFDEWKAAERAYAAAGYRTFPAGDWFSSMPREGVVPFGLWHLILVERDKDEEPVYHALKMQRDNKALQIPGVDIKKLRKELDREAAASKMRRYR